jgi:hypothetical protein
MRLPLFVAVRPKVGLTSPLVLLSPGTWKLQSNGNSVVSLDGEVQEELVISETRKVSATILTEGIETSLTLYIDNGT